MWGKGKNLATKDRKQRYLSEIEGWKGKCGKERGNSKGGVSGTDGHTSRGCVIGGWKNRILSRRGSRKERAGKN